jgi:hypothetical protein
VLARLSGTGGEAAAVFRLDTSFGGGKTHGLIALAHAAKGMAGVGNVAEFVDPKLVPAPGAVRIGAFDGENAPTRRTGASWRTGCSRERHRASWPMPLPVALDTSGFAPATSSTAPPARTRSRSCSPGSPRSCCSTS